jgi:light-regulated signal transduction histidine kinase (bacteriophytochrome)
MYQDQYGASLDETEKKYLDAIIRSTGRMQLLIKGILDYSLIGSDKTKSSIDLNQLIKSVLEDMEFTIRDSGVLVTVSELPTLVAYQEIRVVFQNLLSNAVKFRKPDGVCTIQINASPGYKEWIFSIADNGIGIDRMYHQQIFTIFQKLHPRSRFEGAGIGLRTLYQNY